MNKKIDKLWELIKSLSTSEKRYFKLYANKHAVANSNNYIRLFNVVNKQENYDEEAIRKSFEGEKFLNQLHVTKHYLYQLILKSLRSFHAGKSVDSKISLYFQDIELLFNKGLMSQCQQQISRAKTYMEAQKKYLDLFRLSRWEREVNNEMYKYTSDEIFTTALDKEKELLEEIVNLSDYMQLRESLFYFIGKTGFSSGGAIAQIKTYLKHPLLESVEHALTFRAKIIYYEIYSLCYHVIHDWKQMEKSVHSALELWEANPEFIKTNVQHYLICIARYCSVLIEDSSKVTLFFQTLEKLQGLDVKKKPVRLKIESIYYNALSRFYKDSGDEKQAAAFLTEVETWLSNNKLVKNEFRLLILSNIAHLRFMMNDFEGALKYLNIILDLKTFNVRYDVQRFVRLRILIIYVELGYFDLLEYATRSLVRFFNKSDSVYEIERSFVRFIQNELSQSISSNDFKQSCRNCMVILNKIMEDDPYESLTLEYFDFMAWLESKVTEQTYAGILRKKYFSKKEEVKARQR